MKEIKNMTQDEIIERLQSATTLLVETQRKVEAGETFEAVSDALDDAENDIRQARAALALKEHRQEKTHTLAGPDVGGSPGSQFTRGTVACWVDGQPKIMTVKGWDLLRAVADERVFNLRGAQVAVARKLADHGLAVLADDGVGPLTGGPHGGRVDGERWSVKLTALGQLVASLRETNAG